MSMRLEGEKELYEALKRLDSRLSDVMLDAVEDGAEPILRDMRGRIHSVSGNLAASLEAQPRRGRSGDWQGVRIGATQPRGAHAHLVEHGHRTKSGGHVPAHPFARPAIRAKKAEAVARIEAKLREAVHGES